MLQLFTSAVPGLAAPEAFAEPTDTAASAADLLLPEAADTEVLPIVSEESPEEPFYAEDLPGEIPEAGLPPLSSAEEKAAEYTDIPLRVEARETDPQQRSFLLTLQGAEPEADTLIWFDVAPLGNFHAVMRYPARYSDGAYLALTNTFIHKAPGIYQVTACCGDPSSPQILGETSFYIRGIAAGTVTLAADPQTGLFTCVAGARGETAEVASMRAAIWQQPDQSDIQWTDLHQQDSLWVSDPLDVRDFGGFGTYTAHVYAQLENGVESLAAGTQVCLEPRNYLQAGRTGLRQYRIDILGPSSTDNLRAAVWSLQQGQDDLVWYPASEMQDGTWCANVLTSNHRSSGTYMAHIYAGNELLGAVTFEVSAGDMVSEAEARLARHCQQVYNSVGTDLHASYLWVIRNIRYTRRSGHLTPAAGYSREQWYAVEGFEKHTGNCYTYAATFCQLAKHLGYNARYVEGAVYGVGQKWWPHGFVLITINGSTYICDPELQYASSAGRNLYMQPVSSPRATYRW